MCNIKFLLSSMLHSAFIFVYYFFLVTILLFFCIFFYLLLWLSFFDLNSVDSENLQIIPNVPGLLFYAQMENKDIFYSILFYCH